MLPNNKPGKTQNQLIDFGTGLDESNFYKKE
jgi:hypothetical protein